MVKNKRLRKIIFCCLGLILVLSCSVVPAFAEISGDYFSIIPFDFLSYSPPDGSDPVVFPCPFNSVSSRDLNEPSTLKIGTASFDYQLYLQSNSILSTAVTPNWNMDGSISLFARDVYVSLVDLRDGNFLLGLTGDDDPSCKVFIDGYIMTYSVVDGEYFLSGEYFTYTESSDYWDLCEILYDKVLSSKASGDAVIYFHSLQVIFSEFSSNADGLHFDFTRTDYPISCLTWASSLDLSHTVNNIDAGDFSLTWLTTAVSGFLDVEIWDGFTLNGILSLAFIVGLLFLFLKLTI